MKKKSVTRDIKWWCVQNKPFVNDFAQQQNWRVCKVLFHRDARHARQTSSSSETRRTSSVSPKRSRRRTHQSVRNLSPTYPTRDARRPETCETYAPRPRHVVVVSGRRASRVRLSRARARACDDRRVWLLP